MIRTHITKYDIAMSQKFCCSNSKESYRYTVNSTSDPIKRQIVFNSKINVQEGDIKISIVGIPDTKSPIF